MPDLANGEANANGAIETTNGAVTGKRKREADENLEAKGDKSAKRFAKMSVAEGGDGDLADRPIILEDDSGTILIDDD